MAPPRVLLRVVGITLLDLSVGYTVKKVCGFPVPSPDVTYWPGKILLISARESLVSDIPAGVGITVILFLQCSGRYLHHLYVGFDSCFHFLN
jgi:hypothetical protein